MEPITPSSPILLVPSWGATLPLLTIALLAKDHYTISLYMQPHGETCGESFEKHSLRLMKWGYQWIQSSHWLHWKYAYPGSYCITTTPFNCTNCTTQVWGRFLVSRDTSLGGICCYDGMVSLEVTFVEPHRYDPTKKSVHLKLDLDVRNTCATRFHVHLLDADSESCRLGAAATATNLGNEELLVSRELAFHDVPVNTSTICAQITPRCDECAFMCAPSFHPLDVNQALSRSDQIQRSSGSFPVWEFLFCWFVMTALSSVLIMRVLKQKRPSRNQIPLIHGQYSVIHFE